MEFIFDMSPLVRMKLVTQHPNDCEVLDEKTGYEEDKTLSASDVLKLEEIANHSLRLVDIYAKKGSIKQALDGAVTASEIYGFLVKKFAHSEVALDGSAADSMWKSASDRYREISRRIIEYGKMLTELLPRT